MPARPLQMQKDGGGSKEIGMARDDRDLVEEEADVAPEDGESHATMGGAAAAGAVTGGVIGMAGGPVGAAIGALGGAIVGAAAERMMHSEENSQADASEGELDSDARRVRPSGESEQ